MTESESEFEFEEDDCDVYDNDAAGSFGSSYGAGTQLPDKLVIENAYYEAEDAVSHGPAKAVELFTKLYQLIESKQSSDTPMATESLMQWQAKVLQHLIKLPGLDLPARCQYFMELLKCLEKVGMGIDSSSAIAGSLDAFDTRIHNADDAALHRVLPGLYKAAASTASSLGNISAMQSTTIRLGHYLAKHGSIEDMEEWLRDTYRAWMVLQSTNKSIPLLEKWSGTDDILYDPYLYAAINQSPQEDSHILGILALDLDFCRRVNDHSRPTKLMFKCRNLSRALVDRRTLGMLRENVGKFEFLRGQYDEAYRAFYDTWEAAFSMGNSLQACILLLRLILCNIMSGSNIDPLSTREAKTLLGQETSDHSFPKQIDFLVTLRRHMQQHNVKEVKRLLDTTDPSINAIEADPFLKSSSVSKDLLMQVRKDMFVECCNLWSDMKSEWLRSKLEFDTTDQLTKFAVQMFWNTTEFSGIVHDDQIVVKQTDARMDTLTALVDVCEDLLGRAQAINAEIC